MGVPFPILEEGEDTTEMVSVNGARERLWDQVPDSGSLGALAPDASVREPAFRSPNGA